MEIVGVRKLHRLDKQNCLLVNAIIVSYFLSAVSRMIRCLILAESITLTKYRAPLYKNEMLPNKKASEDLPLIIPFKKNERYFLKRTFNCMFFGQLLRYISAVILR